MGIVHALNLFQCWTSNKEAVCLILKSFVWLGQGLIRRLPRLRVDASFSPLCLTSFLDFCSICVSSPVFPSSSCCVWACIQLVHPMHHPLPLCNVMLPHAKSSSKSPSNLAFVCSPPFHYVLLVLLCSGPFFVLAFPQALSLSTKRMVQTCLFKNVTQVGASLTNI